jgi:phenylalanyl-tRNA synthetase beta chain
MKFTLSWLKEHLETSASLETITETLTRIGLEVEAVEDKAASSEALCHRVRHLGRAASQRRPAAGVQSRYLGSGEPVQVVCGARTRGTA